MTTYWDTSAVINAAISTDVFRRLEKGDNLTRVHTLSEFFCTMTGRGIKLLDESGQSVHMRLTAKEAAAWLRLFVSQGVRFEELTGSEVLAALDKAQSQDVQGGSIYDYLHALAAKKAKADELLTRNTNDFERFTDKVVWP